MIRELLSFLSHSYLFLKLLLFRNGNAKRGNAFLRLSAIICSSELSILRSHQAIHLNYSCIKFSRRVQLPLRTLAVISEFPFFPFLHLHRDSGFYASECSSLLPLATKLPNHFLFSHWYFEASAIFIIPRTDDDPCRCFSARCPNPNRYSVF